MTLNLLLNGTIPSPMLSKEFSGKPGYISLGEDSPFIKQISTLSQYDLNELIKQIHSDSRVTWSLSGDKESRKVLYAQNETITREGRTAHVGIDINVPAGTVLYSPLDAEVIMIEYDAEIGSYGWFTVLKCNEGVEDFYLLFGHVAKDGLAPVGTKLKKGDAFAKIGDFHENGNWFHHVHFQVITQRGFEEGWVNRGLCRPEQFSTIDELCPCPLPLIVY